MRNFVQFLKNAKGKGQFPALLDSLIEMNGFPGTKAHDNLFAVSQFFMKNCPSDDSEKVLEAVIVAYHRWLAETMNELGKSVERAIAANRVCFVEDESKKDVIDWEILNKALIDLAGAMQDFEIASNNQLLHEHEEST